MVAPKLKKTEVHFSHKGLPITTNVGNCTVQEYPQTISKEARVHTGFLEAVTGRYEIFQ